MRCALNLKRLTQQAGRLAVAALIVAGLGAGIGTRSVSADESGAAIVPQLISVVGDSPMTLKVMWLDRTNAEQYFEIYVAKDADPATVAGLTPYKAPGLQGTGSTGTYEVTGLEESTYYCVRVDALLPRDSIGVPSTGLSDSMCATTKAMHLSLPIQTRGGAGAPFCVACPGSGIIGKPSNFSGQRVSSSDQRVLLTWDPISSASFYQLRAVSHQDGVTDLGVGNGANDIGAAKATVTINGRQVTGFIADGTATSVPGGADYYLKACTAPDQCGGEAMVFVPGP
jgi:hypothetical protein